MPFQHAKAALIGFRDAECPVCKGTCFLQVQAGPVKIRQHPGSLEVQPMQDQVVFLCATFTCRLRALKIEECVEKPKIETP